MRYTSFLGITLVAITMTSCEKVINVDLNDSAKKYVVDATLTNEVGSAKVLISQSKNFDEDNNFAGISGAQVTITDQDGIITNLPETATGTYTAATLQGVPGKTYHLKIVVNGETFTAASTMPQPVPLDSIYITDETLFGDTRKTVNIKYKDPAGLGNSYRFVQYVNARKENTIFVRNDDLSDGRNVDTPLWARDDDDDDDDKKIKSGDIVTVDMFSIDPAVYKFWYSLFMSATGDSNATPANPVTNVTGGSLGYFSAQSIQTKTITVP